MAYANPLFPRLFKQKGKCKAITVKNTLSRIVRSKEITVEIERILITWIDEKRM
jgi:hypothetical protein